MEVVKNHMKNQINNDALEEYSSLHFSESSSSYDSGQDDEDSDSSSSSSIEKASH